MKTTIALLAMTAALGLAAGQAAAGTAVYNTTGPLGGNQNWMGTLGLDFTVNSSVTVDALGAFDAGSDGFGDAVINVVIYNSQGVAVTPIATFSGANPGATAYVFHAIGPVQLTPSDYQVAAWGYGDVEFNFNNSGPGGPIVFNSLGGALTAVGSRYGSTPGGGIGLTHDDGTTRYGAGSFEASPTGVPEPASWALMLSGFGLAGAALRRGRSYRLVEFGADGHASSEDFRATDDHCALTQAVSVAEGAPFELWRGATLVERFGPQPA